MKVYVITAEIVFDGDHEEGITRVFAKEADALYCLNALKKEMHKNYVADGDWVEDNFDYSYYAYLDGWSNDNHATARMQEIEVE